MLKKILYALTGTVEITNKSFRVYVANSVSLDRLEEILQSKKGFSFARITAEREKITVQEKSLYGQKPALEILSAMNVLPGSASMKIAEAMQTPRFVLNIDTVENSSKKANRLAEELARQIAEEGRGLAQDWSYGEIYYRSSGLSSPSVKPKENESPKLRIEWSISARARPKDFMPKVIALWQSLEPRLLPLQFGGAAELNSPVVNHNYEAFVDRVENSAKESLRTVTWRGAMGSGSFLHTADDSLYKRLPERYQPRHLLTLQIDMEPFENESNFSKTFDELFQGTAITLDAFFASAIVIRFGTNPNGWQQYMVDNYSLSFGPWWEGLPSLPYWSGWYGRAYYPLVKESLENLPQATEFPGKGYFLKLGDFPQNLDELQGKFPELPQSLLLIETTPQKPGSISSRSYDPAQFIPEL